MSVYNLFVFNSESFRINLYWDLFSQQRNPETSYNSVLYSEIFYFFFFNMEFRKMVTITLYEIFYFYADFFFCLDGLWFHI